MKRILPAGLAILASFAMLCPFAGAESPILDEIVVKGQKEAQSEESLTIREVRESPARDIGEALKQVEGLTCVRKGAIANDIVLRGYQRDNINVLMDGVRIHGACPSRMDSPAFHYDFAEVEQIRVVKGPYDLVNPGSMGGLVDAITRRPKTGFGSDLNFTYGSYDAMNASGTLSYGTKRYDGLVGYAYKYSLPPRSGDGKRITEIYPSTSNNRYRSGNTDSTAYEINTGWAKFGFNPTDNSRTTINYSYQDADHLLYPYLFMDAEYDRTHRLNWEYRIENVSPLVRELKVQAYWNSVKHLMNDSLRESSNPNNPALPAPIRALLLTRPYSMQTDASTQVYGFKVNSLLKLGPGEMKSGVDYYNRNWDALNILAPGGFREQPMIPDVFVDNIGLFTEYVLPLGSRVQLKGGVRGDFTWVNAEKLASGRFSSFYQPYYPGSGLANDTDFAEVSGNLQLTWSPLPWLEVFTGLGSGTRTPDPQELFIGLQKITGTNQVGNPNLGATRNNEADLGVRLSAERFFVHASVFYSDLDDYINVIDVADPDGAGALLSARTYENIDARMWGAEFGSQVSLPLDLYLKGSFSYTEGKNRDGDRPLSEIPPLKGTLALRYDIDTFFFEVAEQFAASQDRVDSELRELPTAGWLITDLKSGFRYKELSVYAGVNNLLDKYYFSHLSYQRDPFSAGQKVPENGRNFYITASCRF